MPAAQDAHCARAGHRRQGEDAADRLGVLHGPAQEDADGPQDRPCTRPSTGPVLAPASQSQRAACEHAMSLQILSRIFCSAFARFHSKPLTVFDYSRLNFSFAESFFEPVVNTLGNSKTYDVPTISTTFVCRDAYSFAFPKFISLFTIIVHEYFLSRAVKPSNMFRFAKLNCPLSTFYLIYNNFCDHLQTAQKSRCAVTHVYNISTTVLCYTDFGID